MFAAAHEAFTRSGRGAKQIHEKPRIAVEIANEVQIFVGTEILQRAGIAALLLILRPEALRHRKIVMNAGDCLHDLAVAIAQSLAIQSLELAHVRRAKQRYRYFVFAAKRAGHARSPKHFLVI